MYPSVLAIIAVVFFYLRLIETVSAFIYSSELVIVVMLRDYSDLVWRKMFFFRPNTLVDLVFIVLE